jgi:hypothetical protein
MDIILLVLLAAAHFPALDHRDQMATGTVLPPLKTRAPSNTESLLTGALHPIWFIPNPPS